MKKSLQASFTFIILIICSLLFNFSLCTRLVIPLPKVMITASNHDEVDDERPFTYKGEGNGPEKWGDIKAEWKQCGQGKLQSPIDLVSDRVTVFPGLGNLQMDYKPAPATVHNRGHDIIVNWKSYAGSIKINGTVYNLVQCHWHSPTEHTVNGTSYDMELHIVHSSSKEELAVIAILYEYGRPDPFLSKLFEHIKEAEVGREERAVGTIDLGEIEFGTRQYYRYLGSLTVPPCTEGVVWTIVKKVATVSREQVKALRDAVHDGFEENARPLQDLGGRDIYLYKPINSNPLI